MALRNPALTMLVLSLLVLLVYSSETDARDPLIEFINLDCPESIVESSPCGAGGPFNGGDGALTGTFVCRQRRTSLRSFFISDRETTCAPTVLGQVIGFEGDECGCCNGACPDPCACVCDEAEDKVLVKKERTLFGDAYECVSRGKASRWVGDGTGNWQCVPDSECPAIEPSEGSD